MKKNVAAFVGEVCVVVVEEFDGGYFAGEVIEVYVDADNANFRVEFKQRNDVRNHVDADVLVEVGHHPCRLLCPDGNVIPADMLDIIWIVF